MTAPIHSSTQTDAAGDRTEVEQAADTLEHCRAQLTLCTEALNKAGHDTARLFSDVARQHVVYAMNQLNSCNITPRPVAPETEGGELLVTSFIRVHDEPDQPDAPETEGASGNEAPRRVRVVKASGGILWYLYHVGQEYEVQGVDSDGDYFVYDGQVLRCLLVADTEPVTDALPDGRLSARERRLVEAVDALLEYREHNTLNWQLEKADDFFRLVRRAREAYPADEEAATKGA